jgi:zinc transport system substrate-binding protein
MIVMVKPVVRLLPLLLLAGVLVAGCSGQPSSSAGKLRVVTSFYPLQFIAQRVAGANAIVQNLTQPGMEPHDLELTVAQTGAVADADLVFYEKGLAPAVDRAVTSTKPAHIVDATRTVRLQPAQAGSGESGIDPHFWQDATLVSAAAVTFEKELAQVDPKHATEYGRNLAKLRLDLTKLDHDITAGLAHCDIKTVVVSHDAFEYYGRRYGLNIKPIAGLSPDAEPSPAHIMELQRLIRTEHITTVFSETLASPQMAHSLAHDLGIHAGVLDPIEGLSTSTAHQNYLSLMRANLTALRVANSCTS